MMTIHDDDLIIKKALQILESRINYNTDTFNFTAPSETKDFVRLKLADKEHEVFACIFLNAQHKLIKYSELFRGTIDAATIYPREVVKEALACNAHALIFAHNHPSGSPEPSQTDQQITQKLKSALSLMDIQVLDHLIVGKTVTSFAERGLI